MFRVFKPKGKLKGGDKYLTKIEIGIEIIKELNVKETLGNLYGLRTWIEYRFQQAKQELGWHDYHLIADIERRKP